MNTQQLDPVSVAVTLTSVVFGPAIAGIIGPYAIIVLSAGVGFLDAWDYSDVMQAYGNTTLLVDVTDY